MCTLNARAPQGRSAPAGAADRAGATGTTADGAGTTGTRAGSTGAVAEDEQP
ncbi:MULTISPECIES: hypothetical protein [unclassified Streptomyces]|uniref:hypothetical protein n=1 Tax=unclassified Streptomyces TaxID=2593676 RepID=UPI002DD8B7DA|nr:hypothetical protein [Streptomyces sp. NBC_01237]WRZ73142.1 hypothetical protein OG251_16720 [Streptomyces sp. NBC_01237]